MIELCGKVPRSSSTAALSLKIELVAPPLVQPTTSPLFASTPSKRRLSAVTSLLNHWHLASLDAPTVAATWTLAFAWTAHVHLPAWVPILTVLAVWSVYVGDRILDVHSGLRAGGPDPLRERHFFHWRNRRVLLLLAALAAIAAAGIIFSLMPISVRKSDSFLAAVSLLYFTRVHTGRTIAPLISNQFLVGLLFTLGCVLPAFSCAASRLGLLIPAVFFALLAWLNCHAIKRWESTGQIACGGRCSRSRLWDLGSQGISAGLLALAGAALSAALVFSRPRAAALIACASLSAILLSLLNRLRSRISAVTLRAAADLALLTPVLLFPICGFFRQ